MESQLWPLCLKVFTQRCVSEVHPRHSLCQSFVPFRGWVRVHGVDGPPRLWGLLLRLTDIWLLHSNYEYIIKGLNRDGGSVLEKTLQLRHQRLSREQLSSWLTALCIGVRFHQKSTLYFSQGQNIITHLLPGKVCFQKMDHVCKQKRTLFIFISKNYLIWKTM